MLGVHLPCSNYGANLPKSVVFVSYSGFDAIPNMTAKNTANVAGKITLEASSIWDARICHFLLLSLSDLFLKSLASLTMSERDALRLRLKSSRRVLPWEEVIKEPWEQSLLYSYLSSDSELDSSSWSLSSWLSSRSLWKTISPAWSSIGSVESLFTGAAFFDGVRRNHFNQSILCSLWIFLTDAITSCPSGTWNFSGVVFRRNHLNQVGFRLSPV